MKIKEIIYNLLYEYDEIKIILPKGQNQAIEAFLSSISQIEESADYQLEVKKKRRRRSHDANAYYQVLVRKCAEKMGIGEAEYHNRSLAEVGILARDEDGKNDYMLKRDSDWWLKQLQGESHYLPTGHTEDRKGTDYRWFVRLKPTREMDSKEMARLLDYVIQDAKELGIETMTPDELKRLTETYNL